MADNSDHRHRSDKTWTEIGLRADDYYRAMTEWTTSCMRAGSAELCYRLAVVYDRALEAFITSGSVDRSRTASVDRAAMYKELLFPDLEYLSGRCDEAATNDKADPIH